MASQNAALVGSRIRQAREERGWTRPQLAQAMDGVVESSDIYRWETGRHRPRDDTLASIGRALHRPYSYFVDNEQMDTPDPFEKADEPSELEALREQLNRIENLLLEALGRKVSQPPRAGDIPTAGDKVSRALSGSRPTRSTVQRSRKKRGEDSQRDVS